MSKDYCTSVFLSCIRILVIHSHLFAVRVSEAHVVFLFKATLPSGFVDHMLFAAPYYAAASNKVETERVETELKMHTRLYQAEHARICQLVYSLCLTSY